MIVEVKVNATRPLEMLHNGAKGAAFAIMKALNETGEEIQRVERGRVFSEFQVRNPTFIISQIKFLRATIGRGLEARVGIGIGKPPQGPPLILPKFELGGTREPAKGKSVAVPIEARGSKPQSIPAALWIQRLQLRRVRAPGSKRRKAGKGVVMRRGLQGTFTVPGLILQRVGRGAVRVLYALSRPFRLRPRLRFHETAGVVVSRDFAANLRRAIGQEFAHRLKR